jgi:hypothetical protein
VISALSAFAKPATAYLQILNAGQIA